MYWTLYAFDQLDLINYRKSLSILMSKVYLLLNKSKGNDGHNKKKKLL